MEIRGSCLCGAVRFVIEGAPALMGRCHCTRCRKLGTSDIVFVTQAQFRLLSGAEEIDTVAPVPPYTFARSFCGRCGTSLGEPLSSETSFPINAQCLDDDPGIRIGFEEFTAEAPAWATAPDTAPRFEGAPDLAQVLPD
ncbi:GFA family protein [uncultured Roseobacter sp.]|uniref:GFA family protein n=1 Tax=uncultured Roseobacter sp. TaxID=114847 RepID=UPI00262D68AE|nr:GFA family protein [uncultured Roseobacter sp.]